jgi:hypothetical protein
MDSEINKMRQQKITTVMLGRVSAEACRVPGTGQKSERFIQPLIFMFLDTT